MVFLLLVILFAHTLVSSVKSEVEMSQDAVYQMVTNVHHRATKPRRTHGGLYYSRKVFASDMRNIYKCGEGELSLERQGDAMRD